MFDREGWSTTTNRIAERAGLSIGTLYQYFPDKNALLHALAERHVREAGVRLGAVFSELRSTTPDFDETMRAILAAVVDLHRDRPGLHALMHRAAPRLPVELAALRAFEDHLAQEISFHLVRLGRGGGDPDYLARTLVHAVDAQVHRVLTRDRPDVDRLMMLVHRLTAEPAG